MPSPEDSIKGYVKQKLVEAGTARFESIATEAGVRVSFVRKFHHGSRPNPRVDTLQPLFAFFTAVDRGERELPRSKRAMEGA